MKSIIGTAFLFLVFQITTIQAQVGINEDNSQPDASALLDIKSTTKGLLIPRMTTTERTNINPVAQGLMVYDVTTNSFWYFSGAVWTEIGSSNWLTTGNDLSNSNTGNIGIGTNTPKEKLDVNGAIQIGDGNNSTPTAGAVRWNSTTQDFEGYIGDRWVSLTYGSEVDSISNDFTNNDNQNLTNNDAGSGFGYSVAISGNYAVVGAKFEENNGVAYVYVKNGSNWTQQERLSTFSNYDDEFGYSVAISGDYLVIGSPNDDDEDTNAGNARVYVRSGTSWIHQDKITASDASSSDHFGNSVSISGDYIIVGAPDADGGVSGTGAAYIFKRSGNTWSEEAKVIASDGAANDKFGYSVSISDDNVVIGAYRDDDNGSNSGSAYIFTRSGTTWTQQPKLIASDGAFEDYFGYSVAISGDDVVIGAHYDDDGGFNSGTAFVFTKNGTTWTQQAKLSPSGSSVGSTFGVAVAIQDDNIAIGAGGDGTNGTNSGSAYIFSRSGGVWTQQSKLFAPSPGVFNSFGKGIGITEGTVIVGEPGSSSFVPNVHFITAGFSAYTTDSIYVENKGMLPLSEILELPMNSLEVNGKATISSEGTAQLTIKNEVNNSYPAEILFDRTVINATQRAAIGIGDVSRDFFIWQNGADRLTIDENGLMKVLGTLNVNNAFSFPTTDGTNGQILTTDGSGMLSWTTNTSSSNWTTNSNDIYNSNLGNVGIGISPTKKLDVNGDAQFSADGAKQLTVKNSINNSNPVEIYLDRTAINASQRAAIGVGETSRDFFIWYDGADRLNINENGLVGIGRMPQTNILEIEGQASKSTAGDWLANSDARLKKNIQSLASEQVLEKLLSLQGVTYEWNDTITGNNRPTGIQYGFTAQNIQKAFPTLVEEDNLGYLQTAYGTYDAMYVEAFRALNDKVEKLEKENEVLKAQVNEISELKAMLQALQQQVNTDKVTVSKK